MSAPTPEQLAVLTILVDRAERTRLTPDEASVLRAGIRHLVDQQRTNGATIAGLQNAVRTWRQKATGHPAERSTP